MHSRYERGFQTISVIHLLKLADCYKVSTDYILGRTNNSKPYDAKYVIVIKKVLYNAEKPPISAVFLAKWSE